MVDQHPYGELDNPRDGKLKEEVDTAEASRILDESGNRIEFDACIDVFVSIFRFNCI